MHKINFEHYFNLQIFRCLDTHFHNGDYMIKKKFFLKRLYYFFKNFRELYKRKNILPTLFNFICFLISIFFLPLSLALYFLKFRIASVDFLNFGNYVIEMDLLYKKCKQENLLSRRILIFCPINSNNKAINNVLFKNIFCLVNNKFFALILCILNNSFLSLDFCPRQVNNNFFFSYNDIRKKNFKENSRIKNFQNIYKNAKDYYTKKKILIDYSKKFENLKNFNLVKKKIAVIYIRNIKYKSDKIRNSKLTSVIPAIKYLNKKNFFVVLASSLISKRINNKMNFIHLNLDRYNDKKTLIKYILNCTLFIGSSGGPEHLAQIFNKKILVIDLPNILLPRMHTKTWIVPKLFKSKKKEKLYKFKDLPKNLLLNSSLYEIKKFDKMLTFKNCNSKDILSSVKDVLANKKIKNKILKGASKNALVQYATPSFYHKYKEVFL